MYGFNLYFTFKLDLRTKEKEKLAKIIGIDYDTRTKIQIINSYKKNKKVLFPAVYSNINYSNNFFINEKKIHTLGGISNVETILCNESGKWEIYKSDRYGFNNFDENYDKKNIKIGIVGDSFLQGHCVSRDQTIGSLLDKNFGKTLTIATAGSGTLTYLAFMSEYLQQYKPKFVLWFFYSNDLSEQHSERKQFKILNNYLYKKNFNQNLKLYQNEIDKQLIEVVNNENPDKFKSKIKKYINFFSFQKIFGELTSMIYQIQKNYSVNENIILNTLDKETEYQFLIDVLLKAKEITSEWNGALIAVYIPTQAELLEKEMENPLLITNSIFNNLMKMNNISNIDIMKDLKKEQNIESLYALDLPYSKLGITNHFDEDGYKKISDIIIRELRENYNEIEN